MLLLEGTQVNLNRCLLIELLLVDSELQNSMQDIAKKAQEQASARVKCLEEDQAKLRYN